MRREQLFEIIFETLTVARLRREAGCARQGAEAQLTAIGRRATCLGISVLGRRLRLDRLVF